MTFVQKQLPTYRASALATCLLMVIGLLSITAPLGAQATPFTDIPCPFDTAPLLVSVRCGVMVVPENRQNPESDTIALTVMIAESQNPDQASDPVVYLTGGPGEGAIAAMTPIFSSEAGLDLVRDRDWVVVDQRGTGYSVPRLDCNIFGIARIASPSALQEASEACYQRYAAAGIDLASYTTEENAADFAALREAMGYAEWNLFGVSYGTTLALTIMDRFPEGIRSVVLDSTLPPEYSFFVTDVQTKLESLQQVFDTCAADPACNSAYPELGARFELAVQALNAEPLDLGGLPLNGDFLVFALTNTSVFQRETIQQLPALLDAALNGDVSGLGDLLGGVASGSDSDVSLETSSVAANDGMGLAMNCNGPGLFPGLREQLAQLSEEGAAATALAGLYLRYLDACAPWVTGLPEVRPPAPVDSSIPTLFFAGEWDSGTPARFAQEAAAQMAQAQVVLFPGQGHSVLLGADNACPANLLNQFLAEPATAVDTACVDRFYPPIQFSS